MAVPEDYTIAPLSFSSLTSLELSPILISPNADLLLIPTVLLFVALMVFVAERQLSLYYNMKMAEKQF